MERKSTILIVDDEAIGRRTLRALLIHHNFDLILASSGPDALIKAAEVMPDLILLDVVMPDMDGFEVCRRLRADPNLSTVPIILITGLDDHASRIQGIVAGADNILVKPLDPIELWAHARTITRLNRHRRLARAQESHKRADEVIRHLNQELPLHDQRLSAIVSQYRTA